MNKYVVSINQDCKDELSKIGVITYVPKLSDTFLFFSSSKSVSEIEQIHGVVKVRLDDRTYTVFC
jgi:hypothetical protein